MSNGSNSDVVGSEQAAKEPGDDDVLSAYAPPLANAELDGWYYQQWTLREGTKEIGPIPHKEFVALGAHGNIRANTIVKNEDVTGGDWIAAGKVDRLGFDIENNQNTQRGRAATIGWVIGGFVVIPQIALLLIEWLLWLFN